MNILSDLNLQQKRAVEMTDGPVGIIAGPGTGKTKTLISRIVYLVLHKKIKPSHLLALTFTNKAASEMKERLGEILGNNFPYIGTFHSLGYQILSDADQIGNISIISEKERLALARELVKTNDELLELRSLSTRELSLLIARHKNKIPSGWVSASRYTTLDHLVTMYNQYLKENNFLDFDDLLVKTYELLRHDDIKRNTLKQHVHYIFIDEFQDTNEIQYKLVKMILNENQNIFVIGDPLQSIYSFRGAEEAIFDQFEKDFPNAKHVFLTTNYRSLQSIIETSSLLFPHAPKLQPYNREVGKVNLIQTMHEYSEADFVVQEISILMGGVDLIQAGNARAHDSSSARFSEFAVIYRTHQLNRVLEEKFINSGIPFQIIGGDSLYERSEISFIIAALKYLYYKNEKEWTTFSELSIIKKLSLSKRNEFRNMVNESFFSVSSLINKIIYLCELEIKYKEKPEKLRNLNQFCSTMIRFDQYQDGLKQCVEYIEYLEENEFYDEKSDKVTLMTIHAAKGLEFKYIFVCGFEDGIIPLVREKENEVNIEEEKRLLYVAMTRAKDQLYLLYTKEREKKSQTISRFKQLLSSEKLIMREDEAVKKIDERRKKEKIKRSQMRLF